MTPQEHVEAALQELSDANECSESPGEARVCTQAAIAHAVLALVEIQLRSAPRSYHRPQPQREECTTWV